MLARTTALEIASFLTLSLFAALGGNSLTDAEAGAYGGRIGWSLTELFWRFLDRLGGTLLLFVLWLFFVMIGFNGWAVLERWLLRVAGEEQPTQAQQTELAPKPEPVVEKKEAERTRKKTGARFYKDQLWGFAFGC